MALRQLNATKLFRCNTKAIYLIKQCRYSTETEGNRKLIYTSPSAGLVKLVKKFSLSTLGISALTTPAVMYFWQSPAVQAVDMNSTMFIGAMAASACSTGALSFLLSPYVNSIYLHTSSKLQQQDKLPAISPNSVISIETLDILARRRTTTVHLRDLRPVMNSSFMTWTVSKQALKKQYALEQAKGIEPKIKQHRFWLDQRNGMGDRDAVSSILRIVHEQGRQRLV